MEYGASTNPQSGTWMKPFKSSALTRFDYGNIKKPYWTFEYRKKNVKAFYIPVNSKNLQGEPAFIAGFKKLGVYEDVKNLPGFHNVVYISPEKKAVLVKTFYPSGRLFICTLRGHTDYNPFTTIKWMHYNSDTVELKGTLKLRLRNQLHR
jgi:hypothetical protein